MKCIAIDDEPLALELVSGYIKKTPYLEFVAGFTNPFTAMNFLSTSSVDLVFLDINMPELSGIELLKALPVLPKIIFTTAYSEYGVESYEFNAIDYLLKPIKYERFLKSVNKAFEQQPGKVAVEHSTMVDPPVHSILVKSGTKTFKIIIGDILYIEAEGNYMLLHTLQGKVITLMAMNELLKILPAHIFKRIHKSYIISLDHISVIESAHVIINKMRIPVGITYREQFTSTIKGS